MVLLMGAGAIRVARVHNQVHDRVCLSDSLVSNGPTQLAA